MSGERDLLIMLSLLLQELLAKQHSVSDCEYDDKVDADCEKLRLAGVSVKKNKSQRSKTYHIPYTQELLQWRNARKQAQDQRQRVDARSDTSRAQVAEELGVKLQQDCAASQAKSTVVETISNNSWRTVCRHLSTRMQPFSTPFSCGAMYCGQWLTINRQNV